MADRGLLVVFWHESVWLCGLKSGHVVPVSLLWV